MLTLPDSSTAAAESVAAPLVLVVDDSPLDRRLAGGILEKQAGVRAIYAPHGRAALEMLEREPVALIVSDLQMPEMDGLELVEAVCARYPLVPVILMTAHGSEEIARQALQRGAASYVPKKQLARELADTVRSVLSLSVGNHAKQRLHRCWTLTEFQFYLENDAALIPLLVTHLQEYLQAIQHCDDAELVRVGVALHEAIRNAMHHGNLELDSEMRRSSSEDYYRLADQRREMEPYRNRRVFITARESRTEACYIIRDEGRGFDPQSILDPTREDQLDSPGGRGLYLIRTFMDEVSFNERGNEITMIHRRDRPDSCDDFWPAPER